MTKRKAKKQKTYNSSEMLIDILSQISNAHQQLQALSTKSTIDQTLLSQLSDEIKSFANTIKATQAKAFNWEPLMHVKDTHWLKFFSVADWLALALCNSAMFSVLSPFISTNFPFKQAYFKFARYNPVTLKNVTHFLLPDSATHIHFDHNFNKLLYQLPQSVTHLYFGYKFNQEIKNLPSSVISIQLSLSFTKPIKFPPALTHLYLIRYTPQSTNTIPATLTSLTILGLCPAKLITPLSNLRELRVQKFTEIVDQFPPHLDTLDATFCHNQPLHILPSSLKMLSLKGEIDNLDNLPQSLTYLSLPNNFNQPLAKLPLSLTHITFGVKFNQPIDNLPPAITHITIAQSGVFDQPINHLPPAPTLLDLGGNFDQPLDSLPLSLTSLSVGAHFNQPINNLPASLIHLTLGSLFNQPLHSLPPSVTHLEVGNGCEHPLTKSTSNLTHLTIVGDYWKFPTDMGDFPKTLTHLEVDLHDDTIVKFPPCLTHFTSTDEFQDSLDMLEHIPNTLIELQASTQIEIPKTGVLMVNIPAIEKFILGTTERKRRVHFRLGDKTERFEFEVLSFADRHDNEDGTVVLELSIDFITHEIYLFYDVD